MRNKTIIVILLSVFLIIAGCTKKKSTQNQNTPAADKVKQPAVNTEINKAVNNAAQTAKTAAKAATKATSNAAKAAAKTTNKVTNTAKSEIKTATKDIAKTTQAAQTTAKEILAKIGGPAPALKDLQWVKGGPVVIKPGKIYVVEFWATWCPPCRASIPHLTKIQKDYKDKDVVVIGISNEKMDKVKPFVEKMGDKMDYNVAVDSGRATSKLYMEALGVRGIPHAFVINKKGILVWQGHPMAGMESVLDGVIAGNFDPVAYEKKQKEEQAKRQKLVNTFNKYFSLLKDASTAGQAKTVAAELLQSDNVGMLSGLVWRIMNRVPEKMRDLQTALKAAQKVIKLTDGKDPTLLDMYAGVLFAAGKIKEAITQEAKAVDLSKGKQKLYDAFSKTLQKYKDALKNAATDAIKKKIGGIKLN